MEWAQLGQQMWFGLMNGAVYVIFAAGLSLVFGVMKVFNMAHGEVAMLGAMLVFSVTAYAGVPYPAAVLISVAGMGIFGIMMNRLTVQPFVGTSRLIVMLSTLALSYVLLHGGVNIWGTTPKTVSPPFREVFDVVGVAISARSLMIFGIGALAVLLVYLLLTYTTLGKMMRATSQNLIGAQLVGIDIRRVYDSTLVIAAGLAALAGILLLLIQTAHPNMGQPLLIMGFAVVIVAGLGNLPGRGSAWIGSRHHGSSVRPVRGDLLQAGIHLWRHDRGATHQTPGTLRQGLGCSISSPSTSYTPPC